MNDKIKNQALDLIPDFDEPTTEASPLTILREQARLIESKSRGRLRAVVDGARSSSDRLAYDLVLEVPVVAYRYKVLRIDFGIENWPVYVSTPGAPVPRRASDVDGYATILREIFSASAFRTAVVNMRQLYDEETTLSDAEREVLSVFRSFSIGADESLPVQALSLAADKFESTARKDVDEALNSLIRRGFLSETPNGLGFTLTTRGAAVLYSS